MKLLVTGGAGFIGSNFILYMIDKYPDYEIINYDALTYAGNLDNLVSIPTDYRNYQWVEADITDVLAVNEVFSQGIDAVVHFAAESHVDRSIAQPDVFVRTNVLGTQILLEAAFKAGVQKFVHVSTDEVYGTLGLTGLFSESTPLTPNSPYSASKAGSDLLVRAYHETYGMNVNITRCSNNYGPFQFPEKLIPLMISNAMKDLPLPVYGDGLNVRDWLHVEDHCLALDLVLHDGISGEIYNIGGNNERTNLQIVHAILDELGKPTSLIQFVEDRLGHDRRYAIDASKIRRQLGWQPRYDFQAGLKQTIQWYIDNVHWWQKLKKTVQR